MPEPGWTTVILTLAVIAIGSTVIVLTFESFYGKQPILIVGGPLIAAAATAVFAAWLVRRRRS